MRLRNLALVLALVPALAFAVPIQVAHQGTLEDAAGPVTASVQMAFELFPQPTGGEAVWSEVRPVDVVDGHYAVLLGVESPLDGLLLQSGSLYLQLTIDDGPPMAPRQPVAAAPYAVVAHTAVNVSGGSVDASSIAVDGAEVIDADGRWVGGTGSIDWEAIDGAPPDPLGGLSCADGDRAAWSETSGQWICGAALVGLDRIDTSAAAVGDVLTFGAGGLAWSPASASGGCTVSTVDAEVATLSCGGTEVSVATLPRFTRIEGSVGERVDGTLVGLRYGEILAPAGTFSDFTGVESRSDGEIISGAALTRPSSGGGALQGLYYFQSVAGLPPFGASFSDPTCITFGSGIYESGTCCARQGAAVSCYSRTGTAVNNLNPPGTVGPFALSNTNSGQRTCGLTSAGEITCSHPDVQSHAPSGSGYSALAGGFCALDSAGAVWTWNDGYGPTLNAALTAGPYVALGDGCRCGLTPGGDVDCQGVLVEGPFTALDRRGPWALRPDGTVKRLPPFGVNTTGWYPY